MKKQLLGVTLALLTFAGAATAQTIISGQFSAFSDHNLGAASYAGVVSANNYNLIGNYTDGSNDGNSANDSVLYSRSLTGLKDSNGNTTGVSVSLSGLTASYTAAKTGFTDSNNNRLLSSVYFDRKAGAGTAATMSLTGLNASDTYDLYVYVNSPEFAPAASGSISLGSTTYAITTDQTDTVLTQITGSNAVGNYVEFTGLTGATEEDVLISQLTSSDNFVGFTGFQLVDLGATPEPSTIGLIAVGVIGLAFQLGRKRRMLA